MWHRRAGLGEEVQLVVGMSGSRQVLARQELVGWRREDTGFGAETPWHERSLLDPSVPDACADVQYSTRIRRGFGPGRVPL